MAAIDWILNCAAVLLWINWRSLGPGLQPPTSPLSLASTLKRTESRRGSRWLSLATLPVLLVARSLFYWNVGTSTHWTPSLELGVISLPFRSDFFWRTMLFSFLSFLVALAVFYAWLLLLSLVNRALPTDEPIQRLVRMQLGPIERCPVAVKLLLPLVLTSLLWGFGSPGLVRLGIIPSPTSTSHLWQQAILIGMSSYLVWKVVFLIFCLLYLVNSYVYLGKSYFWHFVHVTGGNFLEPLRRLPVCLGKFDFSPFLAIVLVIALSQWAAAGLPRLFQRLPF